MCKTRFGSQGVILDGFKQWNGKRGNLKTWERKLSMNMAKYDSRRSEQPEGVNLEPIIRGLKSDIFDWDQV